MQLNIHEKIEKMKEIPSHLNIKEKPMLHEPGNTTSFVEVVIPDQHSDIIVEEPHSTAFADNIEEAIENEDQEIRASLEAAEAKRHHHITDGFVHTVVDEYHSCCHKVTHAFHHGNDLHMSRV
ncbi:hypothetical protein WICPIJ_001061 [Wickerhamomyces pijperi]|uniref:Uncharacterized protein n=1 Tax=Wickerhamomyces pijperi TaxID=599730 RepID=A0A9P8TQZ4_WICPI|nr:hypothetical protein WICPIJ_001061 [Wickerhamomyces pijperi]